MSKRLTDSELSSIAQQWDPAKQPDWTGWEIVDDNSDNCYFCTLCSARKFNGEIKGSGGIIGQPHEHLWVSEYRLTS